MSDERDDNKAKVRRSKRTGLNSHMQTHMPQHQREWVRRTVDEYHRQRAMPPRYREQLERLNREAEEKGEDIR